MDDLKLVCSLGKVSSLKAAHLPVQVYTYTPTTSKPLMSRPFNVTPLLLPYKVGGLLLEGCLFDGQMLIPCRPDSPVTTVLPTCFMAWISKVSVCTVEEDANLIWLGWAWPKWL